MSEINFSRVPESEIHPVSRWGYDPIPGNNGEYVWVEETRSYEPGHYTHEYDVTTGTFRRTGYVLKSSTENE
jgi:hypothetical protein